MLLTDDLAALSTFYRCENRTRKTKTESSHIIAHALLYRCTQSVLSSLFDYIEEKYAIKRIIINVEYTIH